VKRDITEPAIYAGILALLLGYRLAAYLRERLALRMARATDGRAATSRRG